MKAALLYPTVAALVEKMACLFPGLTVLGPSPDDLYKWDPRILPLAKAIDRQAEWKELGLEIQFEEKPYSECDFSKFDLLIESVETFNYSADWKENCTRLECPTIVFVCWYDNPSYLPANYQLKIEHLPILVGMPSCVSAWQAIYPQAKFAPVPVGDWWFEREWTGEKEEGLFVLAGKDLWRPADKSVCGVDLLEKLQERFPGKIHHHDGAMNFKTSKQMTEMMSQYRVFVNLDGPGGRPLCTSFTEALAAGMPVVARDLPELSYRDYFKTVSVDGVDGKNGLCANSYEEIGVFIERCLVDWKFAKQCSIRSRNVGRFAFHTQFVRPYYDLATSSIA